VRPEDPRSSDHALVHFEHMDESEPIRVLLCDDHELVRLGVRRLLEAEVGIAVIGEAADAEAALDSVAKLHPDVVVMDVRMPGRSGIEACREIRSAYPETHVLMLTSFADDEALFTSIMAGASGYVLKQIHGGDLVGAIREVAAGHSLLDPQVTERVLARLRGEVVTPGDIINDLTPQERKILALVAEGLTNRQIAERVHLADKTVKNYVSNILMKLGLERRAEVAAFVAKRRENQPSEWP
jgi:two-component system, NarL family, response regulator DevR